MATPTHPITVDGPHAPAGGDGHGGDGHHGEHMLVGHDGQLHPSRLQHHFVSAEQQFEASKLGMWLFLATEILLFGGMFVAYGIFRVQYPDLFEEASLQLDTVLGAANTLVLLLSSLTMAWAIRGAQMDNRKVLVWNLVATVALASFFLLVKYFEYTHKFELGIYPGVNFELDEGTQRVSDLSGVVGSVPLYLPGSQGDVTDPAAVEAQTGAMTTGDAPLAGDDPNVLPSSPAADGTGEAGPVFPDEVDGTAEAPGTAPVLAEPIVADEAHAEGHGREGAIFSNRRAGLFFSIYYMMTGIHALHILIGIIAISLLAWKATKGAYSSVWYTPVENVGLYWHVVDIIWIFVFPLMYLI